MLLGLMSPAIADPISEDPLQERIYTFHKVVNNFIPDGKLNGKALECVASTPNYPSVFSTNYITLDVERRSRAYDFLVILKLVRDQFLVQQTLICFVLVSMRQL